MEVKNGNFAVRMPIDEIGLNGKICDTMNDIITLNERMMFDELESWDGGWEMGVEMNEREFIEEAKGCLQQRVACC